MRATGGRLGPPVVVFDLGMVLSTPVDLVGRLAAIVVAASGTGHTGGAAGVLDRGGFERGYWDHRAAYDAGGTDAEYWDAVLGDAGHPADEGLTRRLTEADCRIWADLPAAPRLLLSDLARSGTRLGLLSNAPASMAAWVRTRDWSRPFEHLVFSADLGRLKPDDAVYGEVTHRFEVDRREVVFFDDRPENVAGALGHGWQAHIWTGIADARAALRARGALPAADRPDAAPALDVER